MSLRSKNVLITVDPPRVRIQRVQAVPVQHLYSKGVVTELNVLLSNGHVVMTSALSLSLSLSLSPSFHCLFLKNSTSQDFICGILPPPPPSLLLLVICYALYHFVGPIFLGVTVPLSFHGRE